MTATLYSLGRRVLGSDSRDTPAPGTFQEVPQHACTYVLHAVLVLITDFLSSKESEESWESLRNDSNKSGCYPDSGGTRFEAAHGSLKHTPSPLESARRGSAAESAHPLPILAACNVPCARGGLGGLDPHGWAGRRKKDPVSKAASSGLTGRSTHSESACGSGTTCTFQNLSLSKSRLETRSASDLILKICFGLSGLQQIGLGLWPPGWGHPVTPFDSPGKSGTRAIGHTAGAQQKRSERRTS